MKLLLLLCVGVCFLVITEAHLGRSAPYKVTRPPRIGSWDKVTWNDVADFLLRVLRSELHKRQKEVLPIPDLSRDFSTKVEFLNVTGHIAADHGWFSNLSSVYRVGDAVVLHEGNDYNVTVVLSLAEIDVGYDHYAVTVDGIKINGHIAGSVGSNALKIDLAADLTTGECAATLRELKVLRLDDLKLTLTGFGVLNNLVEEYANKEITEKKAVIIDTLETNMREQAVKALQTIHC